MPELAICRAFRTSKTQDRDQTHSSLRKKKMLPNHTQRGLGRRGRGGGGSGADAEEYVGLNPPAWLVSQGRDAAGRFKSLEVTPLHILTLIFTSF